MKLTDQQVAEKTRRVKREKTKLRRLLRDIDADRLKAVDKLLGSVAFMSATLEDLEQHINENGCTVTYQNGENQWGEKKSPEAEFYAQLMQRYLPAMKQLVDLIPQAVPEAGGTKPGSRLMGWIEGHGSPE